MGTPIRMTGTTQAVLEAFLAGPKADHYGLQIGAETALPSSTIHPILARLESIGWLTSGWEEIDPAQAGRPKRRYYRLTAEGLSASRAALAAARERRARYAAQ
ncbi:MAG: PadR family transcriptional regulator, partial [Ornithinimicrobium sp.]